MNPEDLYEWDEIKRQKNLEDHGVDFREAYDFDWETADIKPDRRYLYDEERFIALGLIDWRVYRMSFTYRGDKTRIINLRRAEKHEERDYVRHLKNYYGH